MILFGVASLRRNKVNIGNVRIWNFDVHREYRDNEAAPNKIFWYVSYLYPMERAY